MKSKLSHSTHFELPGTLVASLLMFAFFAFAQPASAEQEKLVLPPPGPHDSCPVCGMFPAKYPDWVATIVFKDGHAHHFDGSKDFFKFLLNMKKYSKDHKKEDIAKMGVTDYYATRKINPLTAYYVIGSDVLGPMGHELVPHPDTYDADEFMKDHRGRAILRFDDITLELLEGLDKGEFPRK